MKKETPVILREGTYTATDVEKLKGEQRVWEVRDIYRTQLLELFKIVHPTYNRTTDLAKEQEQFFYTITRGNEQIAGDWIYFPWNGMLVHQVNESQYFALRTNRNHNIITENEQEILSRAVVGVVGLSVGSNVATSVMYSGMSTAMKLADFDTLDTTNLNRIRAGIADIGLSKVDILSRQLYEMNPYAKLHPYEQGLTKEVLEDFVSGDPKPRVIFEIIDNFEMKIFLRQLARKEGVPVIMFSNVGDSVLIDIERFDMDQNLPLFNGRVGSTPEDILRHPDITDADKNAYAIQLVGPENIPRRVLDSVYDIGKTLVGRPQLMSTVTISGGVGAYLARQIILGFPVPSGRWLVRFDQTFCGVDLDQY
ncbi:MAG TPA: ThiF family adenylyltransferase [Candidatus Kapabacteria bacterium]|nr:ThiF family adenylyltransferase [Candidatus Kapabacteria bacterium]